jgi:SH3-like domain-containing protein
MIRFFFLLLSLTNCIEIHAKTGLSCPRFASFRANKANVHVGPGKQYPVEWVYVKQFLPVEIIAEFDHWRQIRDIDGAVSWAHVSLLSGKRYGILTGKTQNIKDKPSDSSSTLARIEPGVIVSLKKIQGEWLQIESRSEQGKFQGWVKGKYIWGFYPNEKSF